MYLKKINEIEQKRNELANERKALIDAWVQAEHPLKPGDKVRVNRYAYSGMEMVVRGVGVRPAYGKKWEWIATGAILKKDGTPGNRYGKWRRVVERTNK